MTKWLAAGLLALLAAPSALACGWEGTTNYYLYHVFEGDRYAKPPVTARLADWWTRYSGQTLTVEEVGDVEVLMRAAQRKNDTAMQRYLRLLQQYLGAAPTEFDPWAYPDEAERLEKTRTLQEVRREAAQGMGGLLAPQYTLLYIRAAFQLERWQEVVNAWTGNAENQSSSVFRDMAKGFYAGALRKMGREEEACEIYAQLGDLHSATWCMRDGRNLGCIRRLYQQDANSATLHLLVEDFVNNAQETIDNAQELAMGRNGYWSKVYQNEVEQFTAFAEQVAAEGRTKEPCLWLTAAAWLNYLYGQKDKARTQIDRAMKLGGSQAVKDNARVIRLAISTANPGKLKSYEAFLLPELKWLGSKALTGDDGNPYTNSAVRIYKQHLAPLYEGQGMPLEAALLEDAFWWQQIAGFDHGEQMNYSSEYVRSLLSRSSIQLEDVYDQLFNRSATPLCKWLFSQLPQPMQQRDFYADLIGTKAIAEGDFAKAAKWEQQVSPEFISKQYISYYMARRDYTKERWIGPRQRTSGSDGWDTEELTPVRENQKLAFAREASQLQQTIGASASRQEQAGAHYRLATILYQASPQGDCWYLSKYGNSSEEQSSYLDSLAYRHLCEAERLVTDDALYTRILFAKSFINLDANRYDADYRTYRFWAYDYSWETKRTSILFYPDANRQQGRDYDALRTWLRRHPGQATASYLTRCDVLQTWMGMGS